MRAPPLWIIKHLQKAPHPNTIIWGIRISTYELGHGVGRYIQPIAGDEFLDMTPAAQSKKENIDKLKFIKM